MKIAIKNPAPIGINLKKWGDYHFGISLQKALESHGTIVVQHFWPEWDRDDGEDVVLVLRGKRYYTPPPDKISLLWVISHPATVSVEEIDAYTIAYVASATHRRLLKGATKTPVEIMRQCTDTTLFSWQEELGLDADIEARRGIIFVANSKGIRRDIIQWAMEAGVQPSIIGRHWSGVGLGKLVTREYIDNVELPAFYRASRLSLNDHWGDMLHYGIINNRIFDCLACGLPVLSDTFPELRDVCGKSILYAADAGGFWDAIRFYTLRYPDVIENTHRLWEQLRNTYSFDARADQIISQAGNPPPRKSTGRTSRTDDAKPIPLHYPWRELIEKIVALLLPNGSTRQLQLFHVFPTKPSTQYLAIHERVNYLSGGLGVGPWHIALQQDISHILENRFDVILVEDMSLLCSLPASERLDFLRALCRRAKESGILCVPLIGKNSDQVDELCNIGMKTFFKNNMYVILIRSQLRD
jgi:hypothetical protein